MLLPSALHTGSRMVAKPTAGRVEFTLVAAFVTNRDLCASPGGCGTPLPAAISRSTALLWLALCPNKLPCETRMRSIGHASCWAGTYTMDYNTLSESFCSSLYNATT